MSCGSGPPQSPGNGFPPGTPTVVSGGMDAVDWTLQPFDKMGEGSAITTRWTEIVAFCIPAGMYGELLYIGQDCDDATAYQRVSWRVLRNQGGVGGDEDRLIPNLEARCGILDGTMMPFMLFAAQGERLTIEARLTAAAGGEEAAVVRARLQGKIRQNQGGGSR